ncbi:uncharacterized protein STEHIDRAFT_171914 [Stereum hirsutum FP-91666 SS1]|uniref:uncharacterized protein n=1 Tax=Stereum hirsutum (strain FP-91666) TaxID=721885 RepID=UPI000444A3B5|nr:uncharacterized protein STEHIDRAFT_171914 [Stereum hirsutum FP-91666 SS1]EIM81613.1 hypothetical protein STEHIDRAFT_171914 [Stereum hirsutum FP-91666 SS1]
MSTKRASKSKSKSRANEPEIPVLARPIHSTTAALSLTLLKDVLESSDTLPGVKYIASVGIKILEVSLEIQSNKTAFQDLAQRAQDMVIAIANACRGVDEVTIGTHLESDLRQLKFTMEEVLEFADLQSTRKTYKRILYRSEDAENIRTLNNKLIQAFHIFEISTSVSIRLSQRTMVQRIEALHAAKPLSTSVDRPRHITEGIYIIRSSVSRKVLQLDAGIQSTEWVHVYTAPQSGGGGEVDLSQLWSITALPNGKAKYVIRNLAAGTCLDVKWESRESGAHVGCYPFQGSVNQTWQFYSSRDDTVNFCTIRNCSQETVLDTQCPSPFNCGRLHCNTLDAGIKTQEWSLVYTPLQPSLLPTPSLNTASDPSSFHRPFYLQSVSTSLFATCTSASQGTNVHLELNPSASSLWYFSLIEVDPSSSSTDGIHFSIVCTSSSGIQESTLDHWGGCQIRASGYRPDNVHHQWVIIPRGDGKFMLQNRATGTFLAGTSGQGEALSTVSEDEADNPVCLWRLVHHLSTTGGRSYCPVVYDSALSFPPPSILSSPPSSSPSSSLSDLSTSSTTVAMFSSPNPDQPRLCVELASESLRLSLTTTLENSHEVLSDLLEAGYTGGEIDELEEKEATPGLSPDKQRRYL